VTKLTSKIDMSGFRAYTDRMAQVVQATHEEALNDAVTLMRETVAVDTGETRDSITVNLETQAVEVGGAGLFLEFGTTRMGAQPFMIPAFHKVVDELPARLRRKAAEYGLD
jgi:HK97 gp10 family phage protein